MVTCMSGQLIACPTRGSPFFPLTRNLKDTASVFLFSALPPKKAASYCCNLLLP